MAHAVEGSGSRREEAALNGERALLKVGGRQRGGVDTLDDGRGLPEEAADRENERIP